MDARHHCWGAANGPSNGAEEACTGTIADGDGDKIDRVSLHREVCFDPWLTSPN